MASPTCACASHLSSVNGQCVGEYQGVVMCGYVWVRIRCGYVWVSIRVWVCMGEDRGVDEDHGVGMYV